MHYIYWTMDSLSRSFEDLAEWNPNLIKEDLLDDTFIALSISFFIWFSFSFIKSRTKVKRCLLMSFISFYFYSIAKLFSSHELIEQIRDKMWQFMDHIKLILENQSILLNRVARNIDMKINRLVFDDNWLTYLSEGFVVLFLVLVLFIFFLITKCTEDSRSLVVFIFKDFVFICILSAFFLIYTKRLSFENISWPFSSYFTPWSDWNLLKYLGYF